MKSSYLISVKKQIIYYKSLGNNTLSQLSQDEVFWQFNKDSNSVAIITKHIAGNMLSRWTNFLSEDGEKEWRNRDNEFVNTYTNKKDVLAYWEKGWKCFSNAINSLTVQNLEDIIYIRNQGHTVIEAINRQLSHYPYHIGQIVYLGKMIKGKKWQSLSIPKGDSKNYNTTTFGKKKIRKHFTDDL